MIHTLKVNIVQLSLANKRKNSIRSSLHVQFFRQCWVVSQERQLFELKSDYAIFSDIIIYSVIYLMNVCKFFIENVFSILTPTTAGIMLRINNGEIYAEMCF